ncbi:MAG: hypothetical protein J7647_06635 [Cyanobacteria bacterium SBLK]|nr:hypothetical protein [Cyanobacteria bacterium SBLK]
MAKLTHLIKYYTNLPISKKSKLSIFSETFGQGDAGNIAIAAPTIQITDGALISVLSESDTSHRRGVNSDPSCDRFRSSLPVATFWMSETPRKARDKTCLYSIPFCP